MPAGTSICLVPSVCEASRASFCLSNQHLGRGTLAYVGLHGRIFFQRSSTKLRSFSVWLKKHSAVTERKALKIPGPYIRTRTPRAGLNYHPLSNSSRRKYPVNRRQGAPCRTMHPVAAEPAPRVTSPNSIQKGGWWGGGPPKTSFKEPLYR